MSSELEFDLGSLTWIKAELDHALQAAKAALAEWNGSDTTPLKTAAAHLHQVYGALQIVDLRGLSQLTGETERLLAEMADKVELREDGKETVLRACVAIQAYLDGLMGGAENIEMQLTPIYKEVVTRRGGEAPDPSELFYPDIQVRAPRSVAELPLDEASRARAIHKARSQYQKGLLQFLQNREPSAGLAQMDQAVRTIEQIAPGPAQYAFWWSVTGLMETLRRGGLTSDLLLKRLCGRIDLQMRRLMEGSRQLAERLFRDVLYYVAQDGSPGGRAAEARTLFQLDRYLPLPGLEQQAVSYRPQLNDLQANLSSAKDNWMRYCAGRGENLVPFQSAALAVFESSARLPNGALQSLARIIQAVAKRLPGAADASQNEALQLEMATALLLAQNAADHFEHLGVEFQLQSDTQAMRLQAAIDPSYDLSRIPQVDLLDEFSHAAQEKLVLAQVTQEIQANLNQAEDILDKFFRDPKQRDSLPMVPALLKQIIGALNILQLDIASRLVSEAIRRIAYFAESDSRITPEDLDWVAEAMSYLGLYLEALRYGRDDSKALKSLLERPMASESREATVEGQMRGEAQQIQESVQRWADQGGSEAGRAELKAELVQLARDADLVADRQMRDKANTAMQSLAGTPKQVLQAIQAITPAAAPAPSAEVAHLATSSDAVIDHDILLTFIEEAQDVLGNIVVQASRLRVSPYDTEAFTSIRRSFHTLKGSGRMVGLEALADLAWEVEQTLNQWLRDERAPSDEMLHFIEDTADAFHAWVAELEEHGQSSVESSELTERARRLREAGDTPPKPEAGARALSAVSAGAPEDDNIAIGEHVLPGELFRIFAAEAEQRLADLGRALNELGRHPDAWETFIRSTHTLAGISRTTGFTPLADAAHALESWADAWPDKSQPLALPVTTTLETVVGLLGASIQGILEHRYPQALAIEALLATLTPAELPEPPVMAAAAPAIVVAPTAPTTSDDLDAQLLPIFLEEATGLLPKIGVALRTWRAAPKDGQARDELKRILHTLKGSARMAGAMTLGEDVHAVESEILELGEADANEALLDELEASYDRIADRVEHYKGGTTIVEQRAVARVDDELHLRQALRQKSDILDTLLNEAGEVSIARARIENVLSGYKQSALELSANVERLRSQLREMEIQAETQMRSRLSQMDESQFDPLEFDRFSRLQELTRLLAESVNDVSTVQENLFSGLTEAESALVVQARMTRNLQQALLHIRMVPIDHLAERLHRVVRQAAKETGRRAQLEIDGGQTEIDRTVLEKIAAPMEHLVRNAVAHGIEDPDVRAATEKPEYGEVSLTARQVGNEIVLTLSDDGAGIDHAAVRAHALAHGWLKAGEKTSDEQMDALLFRSGFSTANEVTELAGRGIGLDVVRSEIAGIGGRVRLESKLGEGTRFTIHLPLTLAVSQVVLARAGGMTYALPANQVVLVREIQVEEMARLHEAGQLRLNEEIYPLRTLAELVGRNAVTPEGRTHSVLLLRSGEQRLAIRIDVLEGNFEAVVKNIGPQLARISGISGATVLGDGRVALIINPFQLAEKAPRLPTEVEANQAPLILVVDDSLTVRKITSRFLQREGFRVATASDGVEALEALEDELPALMLLDIEMPRMDGFEVARHVRANALTSKLPIIMITSRTADKHRGHALELGVDAYMGKPYQEVELLEAIQHLTGIA